MQEKKTLTGQIRSSKLQMLSQAPIDEHRQFIKRREPESRFKLDFACIKAIFDVDGVVQIVVQLGIKMDKQKAKQFIRRIWSRRRITIFFVIFVLIPAKFSLADSLNTQSQPHPHCIISIYLKNVGVLLLRPKI